MQLISLVISLLAGFVGLYLGFLAYKNFSIITKREISFRYLVASSIIAGCAGTLMFLSIIMIMAFLDGTYVWTITKFMGALVLPLILGGVITVGSFVQAITIARYRDVLLDVLRRKGKHQ